MKSKGKRILVIVDFQNDFVTGCMANRFTRAIMPKIVDKIVNHGNDYSAIYLTRDVHFKENYMDSLEGRKNPTCHCLKDGKGKNIVDDVWKELDVLRKKEKKFVRIIDKHTFGSKELIDYLSATCTSSDVIEFCGVFIDTSIITNVLMTRAELPNTTIEVDADCCAGTSMQTRVSAIEIMAGCNVDIIV